MSDEIRIGERATTKGPLKPSGQIRMGNTVISAVSTGEWIDSDIAVEIVGGTQDRVQVRPVDTEQTQLTNHGQSLAGRQHESADTLEAPPAWVEKINPIGIGFVAGTIIGLVVWVEGEPLSVFALSVPLAGAISGWMFRRLVAIPAEAAGPRADHRPLATAIAFGVCFATILGAMIGFNVSGNFLGTSCGLIVGSVTSGMMIALLFVFSHL